MGKALYDQGRIEESIAPYIQALRLRPDYVSARNNLGISLIRTGDMEGAIAQFREVLRLHPGNTNAKKT